MNEVERRQYTRRQTDVGVSIFKKKILFRQPLSISVKGALASTARELFSPGTEIYLKLDDMDDVGIYATVKWTFLQNVDNDISYRIRIHVERIVMQPEDGALQIVDRPEFMKKIISETLI